MRRVYVVFALAVTLVFSLVISTHAKDENKSIVSIDIVSPVKVKDYPGREETIKAQIKNNTDKPIHNILVYITMADIKKNMTVNLEDYSADKPVSVDILEPYETKTVELPIRFVYTSNYYLYTTIVSKEYNQIISSDAVSIEILGNSKIDKNSVLMVSFIEPIVLILGTTFLVFRKRYKIKTA
jgi:hypothetical protein